MTGSAICMEWYPHIRLCPFYIVALIDFLSQLKHLVRSVQNAIEDDCLADHFTLEAPVKAPVFSRPDKTILEKHKSNLNQIFVAWKKAEQVSGYELRYSRSAGFTDCGTSRVNSGTTKYILKNLKPGSDLYLRLRTYKTEENGAVTRYSEYSPPYHLRTLTLRQRAGQILKAMSMPEKAGQMIFAQYGRGSGVKALKKYHYGGYLLFADFFAGRDRSSVKHRLAELQNGSRVKLLLGVDEEGGTVNRVSLYPAYRNTSFKSPQSLYKSGGMAAIRSDTEEKCSLLKSLGINTNFSPVADVPYRSSDFMYPRAFSTNADSAAEYIRSTVGVMKENNVAAMLKHFPGYGGNGDTHTLIVHDARSLQSFKNRDLKPFRAGIESGCPMILVSHNIVECFDKENPATLSAVVHRYLRKNLGFDGVVITDGMGMAGVRKPGEGNGDIAVRAVLAGNDMLCTPYGQESYNAILNAVKSGKIKKRQIDRSVLRILMLKLKLGILR